MKKLILIAFLFCAFIVKAQQNLVLNGSFELNNPIVDSLTGINCWSELYLKTDYDNALFFLIILGMIILQPFLSSPV
jgi:hypothetical protein